ncbi:chitinase [Diaporthe helianthi]|uniref:chitinase n=1 Tax=Diaporthe helianthi TaxID=158607 RepID=A0A2P5I2G5_DIAHE|nr:chitinase [Diaporthe helianthi]
MCLMPGLRSILITVKQRWRLLMVYKTLLILDPYFVLKRLLLPKEAPPTPHLQASCITGSTNNPHSDQQQHSHNSHRLDSHHLSNTKATRSPTHTMPPVPSPPALPRIITYYQTHHSHDGKSISALPLITQPGIRLTHLILAAIHINGDPHAITLNDHPPSHPRFHTLWAEMRILQASGVRVLGMLGGAAKGTFAVDRLGSDDDAVFERYYAPLRDLVRARALDGLDLDVEEEMGLGAAVRLVDRLRADFGREFIITFAPVAAALLDSRNNLSGFDYEALEVMRGREIAWYNCQFYCGWGDCSNPIMYEMLLMKGWAPEKVVVGLVTNPDNGGGFIPFDILGSVIPLMVGQHARFGGVMGWEYFNSLPGGRDRPWEWAQWMTRILRGDRAMAPEVIMPVGKVDTPPPVGGTPAEGGDEIADPDDDGKGKEAPVPAAFEYYSDGFVDD